MPKSSIQSFVIFLLILILSCKKEKSRLQNVEVIGSVFRSYTKGIISGQSALKYVFIEDVVTEGEVGNPAKVGVISLKPTVEGEAFWESKNTLTFKPNTKFKPGTTYLVSVHIQDIKPDITQRLKTLEYSIQTRALSFTVSKPSFELTSDSHYNLSGELSTSDEIEASQIEKLLMVFQDKTPLTIRWDHHQGTNSSNYIVEKIIRKKDSKVKMQWNGQTINLKDQGSYSLNIPDPDKYVLINVVHEAQPQSRIVSTFSDNLKLTQNLEGLITIFNKTIQLRHVIDANKIYSYVTGDLDGDIQMNYNQGILSVLNKKLSETTTWEINIPGSKPAVRFVGKGNIIPQSDEVILPFEAIGLKAIDIEVFKIFDNNILQYLQINNLDESNELYRVGRIVSQSKVDLSSLSPDANHSKWAHFALNLNSLVKTDPNAIYQISIGFKPSYTYLTCIEPEKTEALDQTKVDEVTSFFEDNYYGPDGYYEDYEWNDREDPCKSAFYNSSRFISRNILVSNFGIIAKMADKQLFVALTDLRTTDPIVGAAIDVYDLQSQKIVQLTTDAQGIAHQSIQGMPYAIIVNSQGQKGYLRLSEGLNLSLSAFDVDGESVHKGLKGYIYGERGVWRPGDSIFLSFILNDRELRLPVSHPVSLNIYDAQNRLVLQKINSQPVGSIYSFPFKTAGDAITGNWRAVVKAGGAEFSKPLKIEAIKPNRLKIKWDAPEEISPNPSPIHLSANWLTGLKADGLNAKVTGKWSIATSVWPVFKDYSFQDPARTTIDQPNFTLYEGPLNADGETDVPIILSKDFKPAGKMNLSVNIEVSEQGGDFSIQSNTSSYHPYKYYTGIKLPSDPWGYHTLNINSASNIQLASIDAKGKAQGNRKLSVGLYELEWRWWWEQRDNAFADYNTTNHTKAIQKTNITTNANGLAEWKVNIDHWGRYLVRVCDLESGHCSGDFAYAGWPEDGSNNNFDMATLLRLQTGKDKYSTTETVELSIPAPVLSKMLVTLENGSKVLESHWVTVDKSPYIFRFQASPLMAPAIYAHVELIQPHGYAGNDFPMRMYGILPITIENTAAKLNPKITSANVFRPDRPEIIEVSESDGKPMSYTLDIVDEGLLDLTNFKTPNAYQQFYAKEALGVKTWDVYDHVLGAFGGKLESILSIGGDEGLNGSNAKNTVTRFKSPVIHIGPFQLKKGEKKKHSINIANYTGSVRIMLVGAGESSYGAIEKAIPVKSPLMILPTLPRVLSTGETVTLPLNIFVTESNINQISITAKDKNNLIKWETNNKNIQVNGVGESIEYFKFQTSDKPGKSIITIEAKANGETAKNEIEIETRNPNPYVNEVNTVLIEPKSTKSIDLKGPFSATNLKGQIEVTTFQPFRMSKYVDDLIQYPYGCAEQTTSVAFPQLYLDQFLTLNADQLQATKRNIVQTINSLSKFNLSDGSFALWPGSGQYTDPWVTSYVGHYLLEAKKKGYLVPDHLINNWKSYQRRVSNIYDPSHKVLYRTNHGIDQAYRLYTLALAGVPDLGAMNRLKEYPGLGLNARWRLAAAYAVAGQKETAKSLMIKEPEISEYAESGYSYGSPLRDQAMILETYLEIGERTKAAEYAIEITKQLNAGRQWNTQALAYSLQVLGKFHGSIDQSPTWNFKYQLNKSSKQNITVSSPSFLIDPKMDDVYNTTISIENTSSNPIYVLTAVKGQPITDVKGDEFNNLKLSINYKNTASQIIDPSKLVKGDQLVIEITVQHPGNATQAYQNLALTHILPAGWEIINERMLGGQSAQQSFQYQDIRDDRVLTFFNLNHGAKKTFTTLARASYSGSYHLPAIICEEMYDPKVNARLKGGNVTVE